METEIEGDQIRPLIYNHKIFKRLIGLTENHVKYGERRLLAYHYAAIVKGGRILSIGCNSSKVNSLVKIHYPFFATKHAELSAIYKARKNDIIGSDVYVVRLKRDLSIGLSAPCVNCNKVLIRFGIRRVFYSTPDNSFEMMKIRHN